MHQPPSRGHLSASFAGTDDLEREIEESGS